MSIQSPFDLAPKIAAVVVCGLYSLAAAAEEAQQPQVDDEPRTSTSEFHDSSERTRRSLQSITDDRYDALVKEGERAKPSARIGSSKTVSSTATATGANDFWIYHADVQLFNDDDNDGYFHGIDLLFDADTYFEVADVYAALYLSLDGGPWNEYAVTEPFSIFGATSEDEYVVVSELMTGYPTGSYDLLIELYDADNGEFVAEMGPEVNPDLSLLPLEDFNRDDPRRGSDRHDHGGGALDWPMLVLLMAGVLLAYRKRRATDASPIHEHLAIVAPDVIGS